MNTNDHHNCASQAVASQAVKVVPALVWSGLGICVAAATIYDVGDWVFGW